MKILTNLKNHYRKVLKKNVKLYLLNQINLHNQQRQQSQLLQTKKVVVNYKQNLLKMLLKNYYVQDVFYVVPMYMVIIWKILVIKK